MAEYAVPSPPSGLAAVTLVRDGYETVDLVLDQVTPYAVARIFSVSKLIAYLLVC